jgi:hypothetical protein
LHLLRFFTIFLYLFASNPTADLRRNSDTLPHFWPANMSGNIFGDSTRDDDRALIVGVKDRIGSIIAGSVGIDVEQEGIGNNFASSVEVAMVDPKGAKSAPDSANVTADIVINVEMEDLSVKD